MVVLLYGYYTSNNFGDDLFKIIFEKYLHTHNKEYIIYSPPKLLTDYKTLSNVTTILLGGGEIINDYFMIPLFTFINHHELFKIPIYGISIGYDDSLPIKYLNFIDRCIFRNNISIIDNNRYFKQHDIVFSLKYIIDNNLLHKNIESNTFGYYLIDSINDEKYNVLLNFTNKIKDKYKIKFTLFHKTKDIHIVNRLIHDCDLINYSCIDLRNYIDFIQEIINTEKHLCLRYHSHIICYLYNLPFISFPLTSKTLNFNKEFNIEYSFDTDVMLNTVDNNNIIFNDVMFDYTIMDNILNPINASDENTIIEKNKTYWSQFTEVYNNFIKIYSNISNLNDYDILKYSNYITDQIEKCIFDNTNSNYRYGIFVKVNTLFKSNIPINYNLQNNFIKIITDI